MNKQDKLVVHVVHVRNLKQAVNHVLKLEQVHRVIKFNEKYWLKLHTDSKSKG